MLILLLITLIWHSYKFISIYMYKKMDVLIISLLLSTQDIACDCLSIFDAKFQEVSSFCQVCQSPHFQSSDNYCIIQQYQGKVEKHYYL